MQTEGGVAVHRVEASILTTDVVVGLGVVQLVYAIGRSGDYFNCECFVGSREYLQGWTNASKKSIDRALLSLESKNLVRKEYRKYGPIRKAVYFVNTEALPSCEMFRLENRNRDNNERIRRAKETLKNHT